MNLDRLLRLFVDAGISRAYFKLLAPNDNSKNQIYLGGSLDVTNLFPGAAEPRAEPSGRFGTIFKVPLRLEWISNDGRRLAAPDAQLILYPQYPEVRLSSVLRGVPSASRPPIASREPGRVLVLGTSSSGTVLAHLAAPGSECAGSLASLPPARRWGVLQEITLPGKSGDEDQRVRLFSELRRIWQLGWIDSYRLNAKGDRLPCEAPQCAGYTLEAELGVRPNARSGPDIYGWEIKQHGVPSIARPESGVLTLMTPEPTGGLYRSAGVRAFVRRYGYDDKSGRAGRLNFGGIYRYGRSVSSTGLTLSMAGFDKASGKLTRADGSVALVDAKGDVAASWTFARLLGIWSHKHLRAAYVPSQRRLEPRRQYRFGALLTLGEGTNIQLLLTAIAGGVVYYDPGIKLVQSPDGRVESKSRSQFRVRWKDLGGLYEQYSQFDLAR